MEGVLYETEMESKMMPEDHHRKGLLEDYYREGLLHKPRATREDVLYETERDAFTDGETLNYAGVSCQDTAQSEDDEE